MKSGLLLTFFIVVATSASYLSPQSSASQDTRPSTYPSFQEWLLTEIDKNPALWDNLAETVHPVRKRLAYDAHQKEVVILPFDIPDVALKGMSDNGQSDPKLQPFVGSADQPPRLRPFLSSGGLWNWITLNPFLPGHYDVTWEVLREEGMPWSFSQDAAKVIADASRDPDLFEWSCPAAHAQNPIEVNRSNVQSSSGKQAFYLWLKHRLDDIQKAQTANDDRLALYHLGRALHSIQDLASHRGMTNAEHSWLDHRGEGPDEDTKINIPLAKTLTREFIENILRKWPSINYSRLTNPTAQLNKWGYFEVQDLLGFTRDLTLEEYGTYKKLGDVLPSTLAGLNGAELAASIHVIKNRWFDPNNWPQMISQIQEGLHNSLQPEASISKCW